MQSKLILKNEIAPKIFDFTVQNSEIAEKAQPGQFLHILCGGKTYLRRPVSICDAYEDKVRFIFDVRGEGTAELSQKKIGEEIDILGPLGSTFNLDLSEKLPSALVGGGIGTFPLLFLARKLKNGSHAFLGYRTQSLITLYDDFKNVCENVSIATDDGSFGHKGFVTDMLKIAAREGKIGAVYTCGPKPMMRIAGDIAGEYGVECQVSMEQRMACGVGACVTCTCAVKGEYVRVCKDGPVFNAKDVNFDV